MDSVTVQLFAYELMELNLSIISEVYVISILSCVTIALSGPWLAVEEIHIFTPLVAGPSPP